MPHKQFDDTILEMYDAVSEYDDFEFNVVKELVYIWEDMEHTYYFKGLIRDEV